MDHKFLLYEKRDRIAYVTLNRPEVLNAIHPPLGAELERVWADSCMKTATHGPSSQVRAGGLSRRRGSAAASHRRPMRRSRR